MKKLTIMLVVIAGLMIGACGGRAGDTSERRREILVSAAASLTDAFTAIEISFEQFNPSVDVVLNFAGSSSLREQILEGAPVDVFASANRTIMDQVIAGGGVSGEVRVFATNSLAIAVPTGNPAGVGGLEDFANGDLLIGLCAEQVPCGEFARRALADAGITPEVDTNEPDVRALLTKIGAGELDAGITYATDLPSAADTVDGVAIPVAQNVTTDYPIAVLDDAPNPADAEAFVAFVLSDGGQAILAQYGFDSP